MKELIYKKGYAKIEGQKVPLTDNNIIEQVCNILLISLTLLGGIILRPKFLSPQLNSSVLAGVGEAWHHVYRRSCPRNC